ncbi:monocyte chemotactic protein 1B [Centroberyx gerrardi]
MPRLAVCLSTLLVLVALVALGESSPKRFCCTQYTENPIQKRMLIHYRIQEDTGVCNIKAVVFRTMKGKLVCADPDRKWVQDGIEHIKTKGQQ